MTGNHGRIRPREAGYTLIELLVVIAILGLLASIATPQVLRYLANAKVSTARTEVDSLAAALDLFKLDIGRYPTTKEGLSALVTQPMGIEQWNGPYVKREASLVDPWGHAFHYIAPGQHGEFDIYSYGPVDEEPESAEKPAIASW